MLARMARTVPVMAISDGSAADSTAWPSSMAIFTPAGLASDRVPFGPLAVTLVSWMFSSTPFGRAIGFLATRDMVVVLLRLGHVAQDFAADAGVARLLVGHDALGGGDDGHAEAAKDLRQLVLAAVHAQARARGALELLDDRTALEVLQHDLEFGLVVLALDDAQVGDVALVLQDVGDGNLDLGGRQLRRRLAHSGRILDADQHVGDGISHAHEWFLECTDIRFREIWIVPGGAGALATPRLGRASRK